MAAAESMVKVTVTNLRGDTLVEEELPQAGLVAAVRERLGRLDRGVRYKLLLGTMELTEKSVIDEDSVDLVAIALQELDDDERKACLARLEEARTKPQLAAVLSSLSSELALNDDKVIEAALVALNKDWRFGAIAEASDAVRNDRKFMLRSVATNACIMNYANDRLRDDAEFVMAALEESPMALQHVSDRLRDDGEIVMAAVKQDGFALVSASERLRDSEEIVLVALKNNGCPLEYASRRLCDNEEVVKAAVTKSGLALRYASRRLQKDPEIKSCCSGDGFREQASFSIALDGGIVWH